MDPLQLKEKQLNDYIYTLGDLKELDYNTLKRELREILGEEPAIKLNYKKENLINEDGTKSKIKVEKLESMTIIFTHDNDDVILPISKEFLI